MRILFLATTVFLSISLAVLFTSCSFDAEDSNAASNNPVTLVKIAQAMAKLTACINTHIISFQTTDDPKLGVYKEFNDEHGISELINSCAERESFCSLERLENARIDCEDLL